MAGTSECGGNRFRIGERADGGGAVLYRDSGRAAFELVDGHGEGSAEHRGIVVYLTRQLKFVAAGVGDGHAKHAAGVLEHEVDVFGSDLLGRDDEVALVLAVLVVDYYYKFTIAEVFESFLYAVKFDHDYS